MVKKSFLLNSLLSIPPIYDTFSLCSNHTFTVIFISLHACTYFVIH